MTKRIFHTATAVALVMLLLCAASILGILYHDNQQRYVSQLADTASYIAHGMETEGMDYLTSLAKTQNRITWIGADGTVLYDNTADPAAMDNHSDREEFLEALSSSSGESIRYSSTLSANTINYAIRLNDGTVLRVSGDQSSVVSTLLRLLPSILLIVAVGLILSAFLAYWTSRRIVKPLAQIDLEHPEEAEAYDELTPFLHRIASQNRQIDRQMKTLREQQEKFSVITENMSEGFLVLDRLTNILSYNSSARRLLGVPEGEKIDNQSALTLNRSESFRKAVSLSLNGKANEQRMELHGRCYQLISNPVRQEGSVIGAVIVMLDITEQEERETLRREFTANVSHELKTPLTSISGIAEIMKNGMIRAEDIPHFAENIYREAQRLIALVSDILRLSQLDEGKESPEQVPVDLFNLSHSIVNSLEVAARKKELHMKVQGVHAVVLGVPAVLEEMIYNLCDNAVKYNRRGGSVTVTIAQEEASVRLTVSDTGIGIPEDEQNRVFERFYRVDKSHSREIGGTGLGLSIVKHAAAYHGASLSMKSEPGRGTDISVIFPRKTN